MRIISHRGNLNGRIPDKENSPSYIDEAIFHGYEVEIDVWYINQKFYLGHDEPQYEVSENWISSRPTLWCHAKNLDALNQMISKEIHCFWHETDTVTITSKGLLWCYPNVYNRNGITVDLNCKVTKIPTEECMGICTDIPEEWKILQNNQHRPLIFDVGANIGNFSNNYVNSCNIVAIEANPELSKHLNNIFNKKTVWVENCALGKTEGSVLFYICKDNQMSSCNKNWLTTSRYKDVGIDKTIEVPCNTLDALIIKYGIPKHIKIDTEGYEYEVLMGLSSCVVESIQFEYIGEEYEKLTIPALDRLSDLGYTKFAVKEMCGDFDAFSNDIDFVDLATVKNHKGISGMILAHK